MQSPEYHNWPEHSDDAEEVEGLGCYYEDPLAAFAADEQTGIIEPVLGRRVA